MDAISVEPRRTDSELAREFEALEGGIAADRAANAVAPASSVGVANAVDTSALGVDDTGGCQSSNGPSSGEEEVVEEEEEEDMQALLSKGGVFTCLP